MHLPNALNCLVAASLLAAPSFAQVDYEVDHLGSFGGSKSFAMDINDSGYVIGYSEHIFQLGSQFHAWQWNDGAEKEIPTLGGNNSFAYATNNSQQTSGLVDYGVDLSGAMSPGLFPVVTDLWLDTPTTQLAGIWSTFGRPEGINDSGVMVGVIMSADVSNNIHEYHGAIWHDGQITELPTLGGNWSSAYDINNNGQIAMGARDAGGIQRAAIWENGVITQLADLGFGAGAKAINDKGVLVGWVFTALGDTHAAMWDHNGVHDLGTLGGPNSWAADVNNAGVAVGYSGWAIGGGAGAHAFIFENGQMYDLNSLETGTNNFDTFTYAKAINDAGQIVGWGETAGGYTRSWIAHPQVFRLTGLDAAVADGHQHTMRVEGAAPSSTVIAYWGHKVGSSVIGGVDLQIADPHPLRVTYSDALGHAYFGALYTPVGAAGLSVSVQAINLPAGLAGQASNPLAFTFRP